LQNTHSINIKPNSIDQYLPDGSVNSTPRDLSAFPELFEFEKLTQGGLPIIISVLGKFSISSIDLLKSNQLGVFIDF
jgi:hypothetical protein